MRIRIKDFEMPAANALGLVKSSISVAQEHFRVFILGRADGCADTQIDKNIMIV